MFGTRHIGSFGANVSSAARRLAAAVALRDGRWTVFFPCRNRFFHASGINSKLARSFREWTTTDDERLIELNAQGMARKEIALLLNRSPASIGSRTHRIRCGIKPKQRRDWSQTEDETLLELDRAGKTLPQIAQAFPDRSFHAVKRHRCYLKVQTSNNQKRIPSSWSVDEDKRLLEYYHEKLPWPSIAARIGKTKHSCESRVRRTRQDFPSTVAKLWSEEDMETLLRLKAHGTY